MPMNGSVHILLVFLAHCQLKRDVVVCFVVRMHSPNDGDRSGYKNGKNVNGNADLNGLGPCDLPRQWMADLPVAVQSDGAQTKRLPSDGEHVTEGLDLAEPREVHGKDVPVVHVDQVSGHGGERAQKVQE